MARTTPINSGYTVVDTGVGTGTNGDRIDVWVEYHIGEANVGENYTPFTAYFYAALKTGQTSSTAYVNGLAATFTVDGNAGTGWVNIGYDFTVPGAPCVASTAVDDDGVTRNYLGKFSGNIYHDEEGKKSVTIAGSFTTQSSYISGGNIEITIALPDIARGVVYIFDGESFSKYAPYVYNGTEWERYAPYVYADDEWQRYS